MSPGRLLQGSLNGQYGGGIGYKAQKIPLSIEAGYTRSFYKTRVSVKDADPVSFGFGKPFIIKSPFEVDEYNINILWQYGNHAQRRFSFQGYLGFIWMRNILKGETNVAGQIARNNNDLSYEFNYEFYNVTGSWDSSRIELGFGVNYRIRYSLIFYVRPAISLGLRPVQIRYLNFQMNVSDGSGWINMFNTLLVDRGDQISLQAGLSYYLLPRPGKKRK